MTVAEWQKRLADTFTVNGLVGGSLLSVQSSEDTAGSYVVRTFRGQAFLLDSFLSFLVDTLKLANQQVSANGWPQDRPHYSVAHIYFFNLFRRCRACEILYNKGYPLDAYALMRDIKDRAFLLAGVAHNMITFSGVIGAPATPINDPKDYKKKTTQNRKAAEHRITNRLMGETSGLASNVQADLKNWDDLFHYEVHGAQVSLTQELKGLSEGGIPEIGPSVFKDAYLMYINRSSELSWLLVRMLQFLQLTEGGFGKDWEGKRQVLDESFRYVLEDFSSLGKQLGASFITMVNTKFSFKQPFYYFEADGTSPESLPPL
jgi:hypothetical protein